MNSLFLKKCLSWLNDARTVWASLKKRIACCRRAVRVSQVSWRAVAASSTELLWSVPPAQHSDHLRPCPRQSSAGEYICPAAPARQWLVSTPWEGINVKTLFNFSFIIWNITSVSLSLSSPWEGSYLGSRLPLQVFMEKNLSIALWLSQTLVLWHLIPQLFEGWHCLCQVLGRKWKHEHDKIFLWHTLTPLKLISQ